MVFFLFFSLIYKFLHLVFSSVLCKKMTITQIMVLNFNLVTGFQKLLKMNKSKQLSWDCILYMENVGQYLQWHPTSRVGLYSYSRLGILWDLVVGVAVPWAYQAIWHERIGKSSMKTFSPWDRRGAQPSWAHACPSWIIHQHVCIYEKKTVALYVWLLKCKRTGYQPLREPLPHMGHRP